FETRVSLTDKNGNPIPGSGSGISFEPESGQNLLVAKITASSSGKPHTFIFHQQLPKNKTPYLLQNDIARSHAYVNKQIPISIVGSASPALHVSYYNDLFPPAAAPFAATQARVSKTIKPDSSFLIKAGEKVSFINKGLYLAQQDTASTEGLAFRVEDDYPKLGRMENLTGPLLFICTAEEAKKLQQVGNDKKKFDQIILSITGNTERARIFMRNYFKRVELANQYFTSYKEGWKTDRGMIYIIFGSPQEVYLFEDREVWEYNNSNGKIRFQFVKSPTLFDPENHVLIRDKKFRDTWYKTVDLCRKARF
ncbi:MAG TPA: GWxTD domain-containing protein, partial [Cyclobacteriaceae bacterium]